MPYITLAGTDSQPPLCLHYHHFPGRDDAPALVLLHELGGTLESWTPMATQLGDRYNVYAFDQRCAGRSEHLRQPFTLDDLAQDAVRFMDAVGIDGPVILMGLAMGAVTAAHVAIRHGGRLRALVLCDGTPDIDQNSSDYLLNRAAKVRDEGMRAVEASSFRNAFKGMATGEAGEPWEDYRARFVCNPPISYAMHSEALAGFKLAESDYSAIAQPTLVLTGEHDFIWPPETGAELAARISGAEFKVVKDAAHFPPLQRTDVVVREVLQFLNKEGL